MTEFSLPFAQAAAGWSAEAYTRCDIRSERTGASARVWDAGAATVAEFKGSSEPLDFLHDAEFWKEDGVHAGFLDDYQSIAAPVWHAVERYGANKPLILTGHSLGGALATLAAFHRPLWTSALYTFGCPRVFNGTKAGMFDACLRNRAWRVVHEEDIVARSPWLGYRHVGQHVLLDSYGSLEINPGLGSTVKSDFHGVWEAVERGGVGLGWAKALLRKNEALIGDHFIQGYIAAMERIKTP
jgi:hypothetical protein